ncbi:hypothetical protein GLOIN_2v1660677 [Rhizophagus irregularis DAOM 181602=DAOM 197198]|uniref:Uncharacterized protein n=1 Tax=Rhizophagus irregularis (strain DAOM 181602 / DAOM 197198 / MUCL 43194) TaxID=747089 RepID=A0A2P4PL03_RHIID|nr:hypothetical protein GLOIN_2v1660677 [Rhizophagus irregularis DAOM 181602=DAOM 197198]POG66037.1 hypothetical protein GLOIN_2v1660677 [Rhizophagus irregularis DAOM 181602=DAOM 197198]|eukprot:XP_025172903.1 hypothetical protein GLOIN_2v1660677 [Rhizophagus irregularis DAOM 181602=DAOM 197198]
MLLGVLSFCNCFSSNFSILASRRLFSSIICFISSAFLASISTFLASTSASFFLSSAFSVSSSTFLASSSVMRCFNKSISDCMSYNIFMFCMLVFKIRKKM